MPQPQPQPIEERLDVARRDLLDLTARNRLVNTPMGRGTSSRLRIVDELSSEVFRILVTERHEMSFLADSRPEADTTPEDGPPLDPTLAHESPEDSLGLAQPEEPAS